MSYKEELEALLCRAMAPFPKPREVSRIPITKESDSDVVRMKQREER